jgi:hypothetical protein
MLRLSPVCPLAAWLLLASTGCVLEPNTPVEEPEGPPPVAPRVVETQLTITPDNAEPSAPAVQAIAPLQAAPRDPVPFRIGAGYGALARVDFTGCTERGLPPGYMRVRATFNRVGYVARASVESPIEPPATALDCIADGLRQTGVPAFDGQEVRLSRTYYVPPAAPRPAEATANPSPAFPAAPAAASAAPEPPTSDATRPAPL